MFFDKVKFGGDNNLFGEHNFLLKLEDMMHQESMKLHKEIIQKKEIL